MQIEPTNMKTETKRTSLYTYIRSAHKMMKMRTEIRKHRTLPNDSYLEEKSFLDYDNEKLDIKVEPVSHHHTNSLSPPPSWSWRHRRQLALPPLETSTSPSSFNTTEEDQEYDMDQDEFESSDDDEDFEQEEVMDDYLITLQKLSGITCTDKAKKNTAVLITLSPCALAAANAARQRRQRIRINA
jgi:hypothetical protein